MHALDLKRYVPALVGIFESAYTQKSVTALREQVGLTLVEARIILVVGAEPGIPGLRVSKAFGIDASLVSRSLRKLTEKNYIAIERDAGHARRQMLTLTSEGEALHERLVLFSLGRESALLAHFSSLERDLLVSLLQKLLDGVPAANDFADQGIPSR